MGLDIGVHVKPQEEGYMSSGHNPKGIIREVAANFEEFLRKKFPSERFTSIAGLWDNHYQFNVRLAYDWNNYNIGPMYLTILEFVLTQFSTDYGIDLHIYYSP